MKPKMKPQTGRSSRKNLKPQNVNAAPIARATRPSTIASSDMLFPTLRLPPQVDYAKHRSAKRPRRGAERVDGCEVSLR